MGARNILVLFFSTLAISLVILIIVFNLFFKNVDLTFDTHAPESAPKLNSFFQKEGGDFKTGETLHSTVNVPRDGASPAGDQLPTIGIHATDEADKVPVMGGDASQPPQAGQTPPQQQPNTPPNATPSPVSPNAAPVAPPNTPGQQTPSDQSTKTPNTKVKERAKSENPELRPTAGSRNSTPGNTAPDAGIEMLPPARLRNTNEHKTDDNASPPVPSAGDNKIQGNAAVKKGKYRVYLDGFATNSDAEQKVQELKSKGVNAIVSDQGGRPVVRVGTFSSKENADAAAAQNGAKVLPLNP